MKKHLFALFAVLVFLSVSFHSVSVVYAQSAKAEIWLLRGPPQPSQVIPWGINRIRAPEAWPTSTGVGIQVAVLDTGVDKDHKDLFLNVKWGISVVGTKESTLYRD